MLLKRLLFIECARMGHVSIAYRLLETGKISDHPLDHEHMTPFQRACQCGRCELVLFLFYYEYYRSAASSRAMIEGIPLILACAYPMSSHRMHDMLIRLGADPYATYMSTGMMAPHYLAMNHLYRYLARWIQKYSIRLECRNSTGKSILDLVESKTAQRYLNRLYKNREHPYWNQLRLGLMGISMWILPLFCIFLTASYSMALIGFLLTFGMAYYHFGGYHAEIEEIQILTYSATVTYALLFVSLAFVSWPADCSPIYLVFSRLSYIATCYTMIRLRCVSPGFAIRLTHDQERDMVISLASQDKLWTHVYCTTCGCIRPPNSKHCDLCNRCILDMDHHCFLIATCVGRDNRYLFLTFLLSAITSGCMGIHDIYHNQTRTKSPTWIAFRIFAQWMIFVACLASMFIVISWYIFRKPLHKWKSLSGNKSHPRQTQGKKSDK